MEKNTSTIESPATFDVIQAEVDARTSLTNLKSYFGDKPFTMSQLVNKVFKGDGESAKEMIESLNIFGGLVQVNQDGMLKYRIVIDIAERKANVRQNIEEMHEHIAIVQSQLDMLMQIEEKMDTI